MTEANLLNEEQSLAAYAQPKGHILIKAGAGSGKTRVLRYRVPFILRYRDNKWDFNSKILLLAFGKDIATEISNHFDNELNLQDRKRVTVKTCHSMAMTLLMKFKKHTPITSAQVDIPKDSHLYTALSDWCYEQNWRISSSAVKAMLGIESQMRNTGKCFSEVYALTPRQIKKDILKGLNPDTIKDWISKFYKWRMETGNLNFDDVLTLATELPGPCYSAMGFQDVLADEIQDLNLLQRKLVFNFMQHADSFTGVGDANQSIFGFSGADDKIFENLLKDYPNAKVLELRTNYRSTEQILCYANKILENEVRTDMRLQGLNRMGSEPLAFYNGAHGLIEWLRMREAAGESWKDIAVLYRAKRHTPELEIALAESGIPYIIDDNSYFEQSVIQDMLAFFFTVAHPTPKEGYWRRIFNPFSGLGANTAAYVFKASRGKPIEYFSKSSWVAKPLPTLKSNQSKVSYDELLTFLRKIKCLEDKPVEMAQQIFQQLFPYWCEVYANDPRVLEERVETAKSFVEWVAKSKNSSAFHIVSAVEKYERGNRQEKDSGADALKILTVHKSKGCQWNSVAIWKAGEGTFPLTHTGADPAEERRLIYVAITRAKTELAVIADTDQPASTMFKYLPNSNAIFDSMFDAGSDIESALKEWEKMFSFSS